MMGLGSVIGDELMRRLGVLLMEVMRCYFCKVPLAENGEIFLIFK